MTHRPAAWLVALLLSCTTAGTAQQPGAGGAKRPNILLLWGDDIGWYNASAYNQGVMSYRTPNFDRIAREGAVFVEQRAHGLDVREEPFVPLRFPKLFNLRSDPFERADHEGIGCPRWRIDRLFLLVPAQAFVAKWLQSFKDSPRARSPRASRSTR